MNNTENIAIASYYKKINFSLQSASYKRQNPKLRRNDLCQCGSGKKYKNCCLLTSRKTGI